MNASIRVELEINAKTYNISLGIPSSAPTWEAPYKFLITDGAAADSQSLLEVAIGDEQHYFVGVEPPKEVFELAKIENVVKQLQVVVAEGHYDQSTHAFTD